MPSLFATVPAFVPYPSASPCLPSSLCRFSSLAHQHLPLPAFVVAAAATASPCLPLLSRRLSSLARQHHLAGRCCCASSHSLPVSIRPCLLLTLPLPPPTVADTPGRSLPSAAAPAVPSTSVIQHHHNHCRHQAIFVAAAAANLCFLGKVPFHIQRNKITSK